MTKVKELKTKRTSKKARITMKSIMLEVKKKMNKKQVEAVSNMLEEKYEQLYAARKVVNKIEKQIKDFENKDIEEIDVDNYEYSDED